MEKKIVVTHAEIEKDIITALKNPPHAPKGSKTAEAVATVLIVAAMILLGCFYPLLLLFALIGFLALAILWSVFVKLRTEYRAKHVSIEDYEITEETVSHTRREQYKVQVSKHRRQTVTNYIIYFENGKSWRVPLENYLWCEDRSVSDGGVEATTHRGDMMTVVTHKKAGKIVTAYSHAFFRYQAGY